MIDGRSSSQSWFLRKPQDGSLFGPVSFGQLANWAFAAQIALYDLVSSDQIMWLKAPTISQLAMDWLIEVTTEHLDGPTTVSAIREFLRLGDINADTYVINSCDGMRRQISRHARVVQNQHAAIERWRKYG